MFKNLKKVAGVAILLAFCCGLITCHVDLGGGSTEQPASSAEESAPQDDATLQDDAA
jgi:hypothetical protein